MEVVLGAGDVLMLPPFWAYHTQALTDSVSYELWFESSVSEKSWSGMRIQVGPLLGELMEAAKDSGNDTMGAMVLSMARAALGDAEEGKEATFEEAQQVLERGFRSRFGVLLNSKPKKLKRTSPECEALRSVLGTMAKSALTAEKVAAVGAIFQAIGDEDVMHVQIVDLVDNLLGIQWHEKLLAGKKKAAVRFYSSLFRCPLGKGNGKGKGNGNGKGEL